ncbi:MAG: hypothetical protein AUJ92_07925 [Armatimonadetes bacterium CG2_30_59_28]|nr:hypothetical protein [Armatimonadota bacterium]OIO95492.1 MAG: hypothetical protein AUJ92_07925 [Armatimonadetes bacterium CG2_30_59_28]PIU63618.1 MAG: hypothetical protein COS85_15520 [Armatimonadetes bacterium CG07_land_8_20_14_0_80_59_28]PIY37796.1 MAG: hypothetical protein COZ05_21940 [Armatimonadetes bacterium CG_4_10_14_3_um_filter_59_10]PJB77179.1 MAG: hypothetical protein CO095_01725 [Armatimonadetes bacterium CG_4_9_14_3_um_filter_58_7]
MGQETTTKLQSPAIRPRGFTLIELVAIMFIMVVLATSVMPSFVRAGRDAQLRASTRRVLAALSFARSLAVAEKTPTRVEIDTANGVYSVAIQRPSESGERQFVPEMSSLGRPHALPDTVDIRLVSSTAAPTSEPSGMDAVSFYEDGRADECVILLRDHFGGERTLVVDPLIGRAHVRGGP